MFVAKYAYSAVRPDELSFAKKQVLTLLDKKDDKGWWLAKTESGDQGLVPSTYIVPLAVAPAPKVTVAVAPAAAAEPAAEEESFGSDWERRAVKAEKSLSELLAAIEKERLESDAQIAALTERALRAEQFTVQAEEKALQAAEALQRAQEEQVFSALMSQSGAVAGGEDGLRERVAELEAQIERLEQESERERALHQKAAERATELFDSYESARVAVEELSRQLGAARAEADSARQEAKDVKRKTARMVALVQEQKKEMEEKMAAAAGAGRGDSAQLEAQLMKQKHTVEELREEIAALKHSAKERKEAAAPVFEPPSAPAFLPAAPPPPPPPPAAHRPLARPARSNNAQSGGGPTCPKCGREFGAYADFYAHEPCTGSAASGMMAAIQGGVALKKSAPAAPVSKAGVVEKKAGAQGSFAEMAAAIAKQRAERSQETQERSNKRESRAELDRKMTNIRNSLRDN